MRRCGFPKIGGGNDVNTKFVVGPFIQVIYCNLNYRGTIFRFQVLFSRISQNELELKRWLLSSNGTLYSHTVHMCKIWSLNFYSHPKRQKKDQKWSHTPLLQSATFTTPFTRTKNNQSHLGDDFWWFWSFWRWFDCRICHDLGPGRVLPDSSAQVRDNECCKCVVACHWTTYVWTTMPLLPQRKGLTPTHVLPWLVPWH